MAKKKAVRKSLKRSATARKARRRRKFKEWYVLPACALIAVALVFLIMNLTAYETPEVVVQPIQEQPAVVAEQEPLLEAELVTAKLTRNRTMEPAEIRIKAGTTIIWENDDIYPHYIIIYKKTDRPELSEEDIIRSQKIYPKPPYDEPFVEKGEVVFNSFNYTFAEKGEYIIRDVYSEELRGEITARAVQILGIDIGRIFVE